MTRYGFPAIYDSFNYGYTTTPSLTVYPFTATVISNTRVEVKWTNPVNIDVHRIRLLRNFDGVPDHEEDGTILFESFDEIPLSNYTGGQYLFVDDGSVSPLITNTRVYYSVWIWQGAAGANKWLFAGLAEGVIPSDHSTEIDGRFTPNTHRQMLEHLPKVFTSKNQNAIDEVDLDSDLSTFLGAFSFTIDELKTQAELLLPTADFKNLTPEILNAVAQDLRIRIENRPSTKYTSKLVRDARFIYGAKGTPTALSMFIEDSTGYTPIITYSPNLFLSPVDATFYRGTGAWFTAGDISIEASTDIFPPDGTAYENEHKVDDEWTCHVTVDSSEAQMHYGTNEPVTRGIPVSGGQSYSLYFYVISEEDTIAITPKVIWYDYLGNQCKDELGALITVVGDDVTTTSSWAKSSLSISGETELIAPSNAVYAGIVFEFDSVGELYLDLFQFGDSAATEIHEARGIGFTISPEKYNYIPNPSFESGTTGWSADNASLSSAVLPVVIPGTPTGTNGLLIESDVDDEVTVKTFAEEVLVNDTQVVFSSYLYSDAMDESDFYTAEIEIYAVEPYYNFIDSAVSLPTSSAAWLDDPADGSWTKTDYSTGGPTATGGYRVGFEFDAAPTSGDVSVGIDYADIVPTSFAPDAEHLVRMWVKSSKDASFYPTVTWSYLSTPNDPIVGDVVDITANTWTQIEFSFISPGQTDAATFSIASSSEWEIGDTIEFAGAEFSYKTEIAQTTWNQVSGEWVRNNVHVNIPALRIPYDKVGLSFEVRIKYTSTGDDVCLDGAQAENRFTPSDYFDGTYAYSDWSGGIEASTSYRFYNRTNKALMLYSELPKYIPAGLPYYVEGPEGVEFEGYFKGYA